MKIACIQVEFQTTLKETFLRTLSQIDLINKSESIDIIVLPDFSHFNCNKTIQDDNAEFIEKLKRKASEYNQYILSGLLNYNIGNAIKKQSFFINNLGEIVLNKLNQEEHTVKSNLYPIIESPFGKIGIIHDYELWISEIPRIYSIKGVEILLVPCTNTSTQIEARLNSIWGTSSLNCVIIAACSAIDHKQSSIIGMSIITSPDNILAQANMKEEIIFAQIDEDLIKKIREPDLDFEKTLWWNLWNRRPELYSFLHENETN